MPRKYAILLALAGSIIVGDQATKYLAVSHLTRALDTRPGGLSERVGAFVALKNLDNDPPMLAGDLRRPPVTVVPGFWDLRYVENPGAAWSSFRDLPEPVRRPMFQIISVVAIAAILFFYSRLKSHQLLLPLALSLVFGGAVGNSIDRLLRGYVIDFIEWHLRVGGAERYWPTFNVADAAISVGVALMLIDNFRKKPALAQDDAAREKAGNGHGGSPVHL